MNALPVKKATAKKAVGKKVIAKKTGAKPIASKQVATTQAAPRKATASRGSKRMNAAQVLEMFTRLRELNPHPTTELEYSTPFELLVAVTLSAQATDVGVNKATRKLFPVANTAQAILALGEDGLKPYIATIGLFNAKAKNVIAACAILVDKYGGEVPAERAALEACPGSAARPPTWCSTPPSASRPWRWTRISSASPTALGWPPARTYARSRMA